MYTVAENLGGDSKDIKKENYMLIKNGLIVENGEKYL